MSDDIFESDQKKDDLAAIIDALNDLSVFQKLYLHSRWLEQINLDGGKSKEMP